MVAAAVEKSLTLFTSDANGRGNFSGQGLILQRYKWLQSQTIMSFNFSPSMCNR